MMTYRQDERTATRDFLSLLYHISRELAAALDLHSVLQRVLQLSLDNIGAVSGSIIVLDDRGQPVDSAIVAGGKYLDHTTSQLKIIFERGLAGAVARSHQPALVEDTSQDDRWLYRPDDALDRSGPKSAISAPLLAREMLVGVMTLVHTQPGYFTEEDLALLQAIADLAGIAVLNARLYAESQRQARVMTAVAESAAAINAALSVDDVLRRILEQVSLALRVNAVSLALVVPDSQELELRATTAEAGEAVGARLPLEGSLEGWVVANGEGVVLHNPQQEERLHLALHKSAASKQAVACAPILSKGQVIGVLEAVGPEGGFFDPDALLVLNGVGNLAGSAIDHAQLFERMLTAHQRYHELFEDSVDSILLTDWNGVIQETNRQAEEITGAGPGDLLGKPIQMLNLDVERHTGQGFEKLGSGETIAYDATLHRQNGLLVPVQVHVRSVSIDSTSQLQWMLRDISERKNLDNLRNDLISMIYHDLRSPLANVVSSLDVLASFLPFEQDPSFRSLLNIAVRSTERIQRLTNSLLDINRLEAGQPVVNRLPCLTCDLIRDACEAAEPTAENKDLEFAVDCSPDLPLVLADSDMIRRVLINLMENAIKFSPPGSKILIGSHQEGDYVRVWVKDSGPGIPANEHLRIFDKFTRLHAKDGTRGFGLGLAFCRLAVEGHGGRIWVESTPGDGASFNFTLPIEKK